MPIIKPDNDGVANDKLISIFLAGSIEMGVAEDWQSKVEKELDPFYNVYNPRRDNWDSSWTDDNPEMLRQILWEQGFLEAVDIVLFYFDPKTKSPITLLELGQALERRKHMRVICPQGYWKRKNVEVTCSGYGVDLDEDLDSVLKEIKRYHR